MTLMLRLAAPMQSWGGDSKFSRRATEREPTKSGVVGLLSCALGRKREESVADLAALRFGVRTDAPGVFLRDYHTARHAFDKKKVFVTDRYYLSDAAFLVGLEGEEGFLLALDAALRSPAFPLFLGRRSCPPTLPIALGLRDMPLRQALEKEPLLVLARRAMTTIAIDTEKEGVSRRDFPLSFSQANRQYTFRDMEVYYVSVPDKT